MHHRITGLTLYISGVGLIGLLLNLYGLWSLLPILGTANFWLLMGLAVVAATATTSSRFSEETGITYHVVPAVSLAASATLGLFAGVLISTTAFLAVWLTKPRSDEWKKNLRQLVFNVGSDSLTVFVTSATLIWLQVQMAGWGWAVQLLPWFLASAIYEAINGGLLVGVLRLQHGAEFKTFETWKEMQWSAGLGITIVALGGSILAFAMATYDWQGILVFFFPILLSAYAFRLYISNVREYMENLESIVDE